MSGEGFEIVRLFLAAVGMSLPDEDGLHLKVPDGFDSRELLADDFTILCAPGTAAGGRWQGRNAYNECGSSIMTRFDVETLEPALHDAGDVVFLTSVTQFKSKQGGETPRIPGVEIWRVKNQRIVSCVICYAETQSLFALVPGGELSVEPSGQSQ